MQKKNKKNKILRSVHRMESINIAADGGGGQQGHFAPGPQCKGAPKQFQILAVQIEKYDEMGPQLGI